MPSDLEAAAERDTPEPTTAEPMSKLPRRRCHSGCPADHPAPCDACLINSLFDRLAASEARAVKAEGERDAQGGPVSSERMTLNELIEELEKWKKIASGKTCVSFENLCYGASSLWHQTHRDNFRKIDRKPEALSRWILSHDGCVKDDFPAQVLSILEKFQVERDALAAELATLKGARVEILEKAKQVDAMAEYIRSGGKCHPDFYQLSQDVACWVIDRQNKGAT